MWAFDLIELDADDLRRDPLVVRKATLASLLSRAASGLRFNEHMEEEDGPLVFAHACKLELEGIVSKRRDSRYRSGRSPDWIKSKNGGTRGEAGSRGGVGTVSPWGLPNSKGSPSSLVQLRNAVWTGDTRDTRPNSDITVLWRSPSC